MKRILLGILTATIALSTPAFADTAKVAFIAPDSRALPSGYFQQIFETTHFDSPPMSYQGLTKHQYSFDAQLPPCGGTESACIQSVEYNVGDGNWQSAKAGADEGQRYIFDGELTGPGTWKFNLSSTYGEDLKVHRPAGSTARLWSAPGAEHGGGNTYLVSADLAGTQTGTSQYEVTDLHMGIVPVSRQANVAESNCAAPAIFIPITPDTGMRSGFCETVYDFPQNIQWRMTVRLGAFMQDISGWFDGRLSSPAISVDAKNQLLQVTGGAISVPTVATTPTEYSKIPANWPQGHDANIQAEQTSGHIGWSSLMDSNAEDSVIQFNQFGNGIAPKALGTNTVWQLGSIHGDNTCVQKGVVNGVLSTNAPIYSPRPPTWNAKEGTLNFQVASSHLDPTGAVFLGNYSLLLSAKTASCLWGSDFSRGSASVSVVSASGTNEIATTSFGVHDGWAGFNAAGFTFSSPTIKVKINQKPATITCVKGKVSKVVSGSLCPSGYKQKKY